MMSFAHVHAREGAAGPIVITADMVAEYGPAVIARRVSFVPHRARPAPRYEKRGRPTKVDRDMAMAMLAEGKTLQAVGNHFGVTREYIRQIAAKSNVRSIHSRANKVDRRVEIESLILEGLSDDDIAQRIGVRRAIVAVERSKLGFVPFSVSEREAKMRPYVDLVRAGHSITSVERKFGLPRNLLYRACRRSGVRSQARSRHKDLSDRAEIVRRERACGADWVEVTKRVAEAEGRRLATVYGWAQRHCPDLFEA